MPFETFVVDGITAMVANPNPYQSPESESAAPRPRYHRATVCPHCGEPAMSLFKKSQMGPLRMKRCQSCGDRVGIGWRAALWSILPATVLSVGVVIFAVWGVIAADFIESAASGDSLFIIFVPIVGAGLGGGIQVLCQLYFAPLEKR